MNILKRIATAITACEKQKVETPEYYDQFIKENHELLIQIRKELEGKDEDTV